MLYPSLYHGAEHLLLPACRSQRTLLTCAYKAILHTQPKGVRKHSGFEQVMNDVERRPTLLADLWCVRSPIRDG
jgi:hypothetical protein